MLEVFPAESGPQQSHVPFVRVHFRGEALHLAQRADRVQLKRRTDPIRNLLWRLQAVGNSLLVGSLIAADLDPKECADWGEAESGFTRHDSGLCDAPSGLVAALLAQDRARETVQLETSLTPHVLAAQGAAVLGLADSFSTWDARVSDEAAGPTLVRKEPYTLPAEQATS